jgi:hypothetical protein
MHLPPEAADPPEGLDRQRGMQQREAHRFRDGLVVHDKCAGQPAAGDLEGVATLMRPTTD